MLRRERRGSVKMSNYSLRRIRTIRTASNKTALTRLNKIPSLLQSDETSALRDTATDSALAKEAESSTATAPSDNYSSNTPDANNKVLEQEEESADTPTPEHFYLLRPFTASKSTVLIPIDASNTLTECLKGQTVLEFPTIYVLPDERHSLPAGFQLSEQYEKAQRAEESEVDALVQRTNQSTGGALIATREEEKPLDANSILDMLKRDVGV
jgi:hypothetical protein